MDNSLDAIWKERPEIIRSYYELLPVHQRLCGEVKYILEKKLKFLDIEIGLVISRAKSLASYCEKIERKSYLNPTTEITDFAGVRIVFLFASDKIKLEKLIEEEFEIHEKVDRIHDQDVERFGYGALHYIVSLKEQHAGARYDDLREVRCEIQIRTILQDAWAVVAHHLSYKNEQDIPNELRRKLHALSGSFEVADNQFEVINHARVEYQNKIKDSINSDSKLSLAENVNLDNLLAYMSWKFPGREIPSNESAATLLEELNKFGYKKLKKVDDAINRSWDAIFAREKKYPPYSAEDDDELSQYNCMGLIRSALEFIDSDFLEYNNSWEISKNRVKEFSGLVK